MSTKTKLEEGWFKTKNFKGIIDGEEPVFPLWETIFCQVICGKIFYFVTILTEQKRSYCIDLRFLFLGEMKKQELIERGWVNPKFFKTHYRFDFDLSLDCSGITGFSN